MKLTKPYFYDSFLCTADRCTDNCCIGWEIDIDEDAMERFSRVPGEFGERLRAAILPGECPVFANTAGERCALLREDGLCELVLHEGEDSLCDICALHPRFFGWFNELKEAGLGLCCEEVCRLLFSDSKPLAFVSGEIKEMAEDTCDDALLFQLISARGAVYGILQNRALPLEQRIHAAFLYAEDLQDMIDFGENGVPEIYIPEKTDFCTSKVVNNLLELLSGTESLNAEWDSRLAALKSGAERLTAALPEFLAANADTMWQYEHIAVYTVYRYFLKGAFDGDVLSKMHFVCVFMLTLALMDCETWTAKKALSDWDRTLNVKLLSKQLEYSEENVEMCGAGFIFGE